MIGVDITSIKRFENKKMAFIKKILSQEEMLDWEKSHNKELFLAQRWSIKEAIFKANNNFHDYSKINLERENGGKFFFKNFEISTSKENDYVIAFVMEREFK